MAEINQVICDAGPLIHLDEIGAMDFLSDFKDVLVLQDVWLEVERNRPKALLVATVHLTKTTVPIKEDPVFDTLAQALSLGVGERAAIRLAQQQSDAIFLTDDAAARLAAEKLGLRVHGTIGILIRAIRRNQKTPAEIVELLKTLPVRSSLHIRAELLADIINQIFDEFRPLFPTIQPPRQT